MNCDLVSFDATTNSYCYMIYASCCEILGPTLQICQRICGPRWLGWEALGRSQAISCQVFQTAWNDRTKLWAFLQLGWFQATCGKIDLCILVFAYSWFIDLRSTCTGYNMSCNCNAHFSLKPLQNATLHPLDDFCLSPPHYQYFEKRHLLSQSIYSGACMFRQLSHLVASRGNLESMPVDAAIRSQLL